MSFGVSDGIGSGTPGQVDALVGADRAADDDRAARPPGLDLLDLQADEAVVDQDVVARREHVADHRRRDRKVAVVRRSLRGDDHLLAARRVSSAQAGRRGGASAPGGRRRAPGAGRRRRRRPGPPRLWRGAARACRARSSAGRRPCPPRPARRGARASRWPARSSRGSWCGGGLAAPLPERSYTRENAVPARILGAGAQLLLDPEQLVVLRDAVGPRRRAGLDLAGVRWRRRGRRSSCPRSRRSGARSPPGSRSTGEGDRVEGLGQRADLVHLDQDRVGDPLVDPAPEALDVGDEQVVADELHAVRRAARSAPATPPSRPRPPRPRPRRAGTARRARRRSRPSPRRRPPGPRTGRRRRRRTPSTPGRARSPPARGGPPAPPPRGSPRSPPRSSRDRARSRPRRRPPSRGRARAGHLSARGTPPCRSASPRRSSTRRPGRP